MWGIISKIIPTGSLVRYGLIAVALVAGGLYLWHLNATISQDRATITGLRTANATIAETAAHNAAQAQRYQAAAQAAQSALTSHAQEQVATARTESRAIAAVHAAPPNEAAAPMPKLWWNSVKGLKP